MQWTSYECMYKFCTCCCGIDIIKNNLTYICIMNYLIIIAHRRHICGVGEPVDVVLCPPTYLTCIEAND